MIFSKARIKNSMIGHRSSDIKIESFVAVTDVIKNGIQIDYQGN